MSRAVVPFRYLRRGGESIAVAEEFRNAVPDLLGALDGGAAAGWVEGRRRYPLLALADGRRVVARRLVHGGVLGRLWGGVFWGTSRPLREFVVTVRARQKGVPVPVPVGARVRRFLGLFYRGTFLTLEIPGARDLGAIYREEWPGWSRARRAAALAAAARTLARAHAAGLYHADLNLRNVLLRWEDGAPILFLVDLDRAAFYASLTFRQRRANLWRLARSAEKLAAPGRGLTRTERLLFLRVYAEGDPALWARLRASFAAVPAVSWPRRLWWAFSSAGAAPAGVRAP